MKHFKNINGRIRIFYKEWNCHIIWLFLKWLIAYFFQPLPFNTTTDDLAFAQVASDNALWGPLLEKGIAKLMGNYWHTDQGINSGGISLLNGGPHYYLSHYKTMT